MFHRGLDGEDEADSFESEDGRADCELGGLGLVDGWFEVWWVLRCCLWMSDASWRTASQLVTLIECENSLGQSDLR